MADGKQQCRTCDQVLDLDAFGWDKRAGRRKTQCRECARDYAREYRENGPRGNPYDRPDGHRECRLCGAVKPLAEFYPRDPAGRLRRNECTECHKTLVAGRHDPERARERVFVRLYGITVEQYDALHQQQDGRCAICGQPSTSPHSRTGKPRRLHVDHCHQTGRVRGLLCTGCNLAIGHLGHDPERLAKAIVYLQ